ncbi:hypothetical protein GVY41_08600 [Frigidibacter albus]|uniref:Extensin-like C-terminal domain-containing protein n=1 Tax=Frigidibacter albus TaxID=1465486 RepID=A0A6L8VFC4_9RHOB|nr:extensin family protein [Frigidibacter albus]MZQ88884.1 hypothetical protein [Frigidibacter albus]NBE31059.1 hypothetical protein [Frigidibacter albus]GGH52613.1 hypothetical protein GCM10011341_17310 [Frigidibacter albus]
MKLAARALLAALLMLGQVSGAWAEAPAAAPRPLPRPVAAPVTAPVAAEAVLKAVEATVRRPKPRPGTTAVAVAAPAGPALPGLRPRPRPVAALRTEVVQVSSATIAYAPTSARPEPRPENLQRRSAVAAAGFRTQPVPEATTGRKGSVCGNPGIRGTTIPPIKAQVQGCGLKDGVMVTSVSGVKLSMPATIDCATAVALNRWVERGVKPAVGRLGGGVTQLQVAGHYTCRPRNNQRGAKISEHGRGKAIDISAVTLANGVSITVLKGWNEREHGKILKAMHKAACGPFGTVLGPNADVYHRDHLHLDTAAGRRTAYCR